ncbi:chymotrypsin-like protease CTRL-1 isoform X1 [Osmerus eperlanus]|uniref:chymotrypsin-like protease CTRL-1 isoform X1 n=1 Tax=Osmerus eperlanus TaxID=29151 RepID=UPI002E10FEA6
MVAHMALVLVATVIFYGKGSTAQDCGTAPLSTKIVGGSDASAGSWPWQVSMHFRGTFICGGTLIHREWVLTAAHCMLTLTASDYSLFLGRQNETPSGDNPNEVSRSVSQIIKHPQYNNTLFNNDITLMKLSSPVNITSYIRPVCLAAAGSIFSNATACWASGWGNVGKDESLGFPYTLQEVEVPVIGNKQCTCKYKPAEGVVITNNMICAGQKNKGVCQGDSGGPVQCRQGSVWVQAGIASYGVPCATGFPEVFARVSQYQTWITDSLQGAAVGFISFSSPGSDSDSGFVCQADPASSAASSLWPALLCLVLLPLSLPQYLPL